MDNKEDILDALEEFNQKPLPDRIPTLLEQYLRKIASTGETIFPWQKLKPLFVAKLEKSMEDFYTQVPTDVLPPCPNVENVKYTEMKERILQAVDSFSGAPFTIQRLCELIVNPQRHYRRTDKFMRGIEKNIMVVTTVDPLGNKIVNEGKVIGNGLDANGVPADMKTPEKLSSKRAFAPPPPPANSPIAPSAAGSSKAEPETFTPVTVWPPTDSCVSNSDSHSENNGVIPAVCETSEPPVAMETAETPESREPGELSCSSSDNSQDSTFTYDSNSMESSSSESSQPTTTQHSGQGDAPSSPVVEKPVAVEKAEEKKDEAQPAAEAAEESKQPALSAEDAVSQEMPSAAESEASESTEPTVIPAEITKRNGSGGSGGFDTTVLDSTEEMTDSTQSESSITDSSSVHTEKTKPTEKPPSPSVPSLENVQSKTESESLPHTEVTEKGEKTETITTEPPVSQDSKQVSAKSDSCSDERTEETTDKETNQSADSSSSAEEQSSLSSQAPSELPSSETAEPMEES